MPHYQSQRAAEPTFNSQMVEMFGAYVTIVPVDDVHDTIEAKIAELRSLGRKPYFIEGGGHGNIGTKAYVQCYKEILEQEKALGVHSTTFFLHLELVQHMPVWFVVNC